MLVDICNLPNPASPFNRHLQNRHKSREPALHISSPRPCEQGQTSNRPSTTGTVTVQAGECICVRNRQPQRVETRSDVFVLPALNPAFRRGFFVATGQRSFIEVHRTPHVGHSRNQAPEQLQIYSLTPLSTPDLGLAQILTPGLLITARLALETLLSSVHSTAG